LPPPEDSSISRDHLDARSQYLLHTLQDIGVIAGVVTATSGGLARDFELELPALAGLHLRTL